MHEEKIATFY